jgi:hypothetical protein
MLALFYAGIWQEYQNFNKSSCFWGHFFPEWMSFTLNLLCPNEPFVIGPACVHSMNVVDGYAGTR